MQSIARDLSVFISAWRPSTSDKLLKESCLSFRQLVMKRNLSFAIENDLGCLVWN